MNQGKRRRRGLDGMELLAYIESRCARSPTGCLEWQGYANALGYGQLGYRGRMWLAHRLANTLRHGPIPCGHVILHTCDNPRCCEDAHHVRGTVAENNRDMHTKGRWRGGDQCGEGNHQAKLNGEAVQRIRSSDASGATLAREFGVSPSTISIIRSNKIWRMTPAPDTREGGVTSHDR